MSHKYSVQASTFLAHIESTLSWLEWIKASSRFEEAVRGRINWDGMSGGEKEVVQKKHDLAQPELRLVLNALYITLVAAFEEYLRQLVTHLADEFTKQQTKWASASESLLKLNIRESARMLRRMDSPPDYLAIDFWEMCRQLGSCHPHTDAIILNSLALADVESLIKLEKFIERAEAFGVDLSFDLLGKSDSMCAALDLKKSKPRENAKQIRAAAAEIARLRNRIAHMGVNASDVTEAVFLRDVGVLKGLVFEFDSGVQAAIQKRQKGGKA